MTSGAPARPGSYPACTCICACDHPDVLSRAVREVRITSPTTLVIFGTLTSGSTELAMPSHPGDPVFWGNVEGTISLVAYDLEPR